MVIREILCAFIGCGECNAVAMMGKTPLSVRITMRQWSLFVSSPLTTLWSTAFEAGIVPPFPTATN
jgi:hypothetical protein